MMRFKATEEDDEEHKKPCRITTPLCPRGPVDGIEHCTV